MILYHGSKSGIKGEISPFDIRENCDFGRGFYTGELPTQPMGLIAGWKDHVFYELTGYFPAADQIQKSGRCEIL